MNGHTGPQAVLSQLQPQGRATTGNLSRDHHRPQDGHHGCGSRAALWLSQGPAGEAGTAGTAPRPGQKPPVLFLTGFSYWSQLWAGAAEPQAPWPWAGQWFGPQNQQDPAFGAACCLLPPLQGQEGADRRMAASQPGPSVPFAPLARLMHDYFRSCFNLPCILIRNIFCPLAALSVFHVSSQQQQQLLSVLHKWSHFTFVWAQLPGVFPKVTLETTDLLKNPFKYTLWEQIAHQPAS